MADRNSEDYNSNPGPDYVSCTDVNNIQWEDRIRTLKDVITSGKYPCVVKIKKGDVTKYDNISPATCTSHEDILHVIELRRHKMVVAMKQQWDRRTGEYCQTGKQAEINVTQKGWFEVLPDNGQPVEYFDTINAIVGIRPKRFLVRTSIVGYQLSFENGSSSWMPWEIRPGEVLTTGIIHMDQKKTKKKPFLKRIFSSGKGASKKDQELKYLQCFDNENREIMVPLIMTGVFSPVGDHINQNYDAVYSLHDLISAFTLPIKAQLIHTDAQGHQGVPTGVLLLERFKDNETLLVARHPYVEGVNETFEIPLNDEFHVLKEKRKKANKKTSIVSMNEIKINDAEDTLVKTNSQIDLPIRVKDTKKNKGSAILDKLSVRSKGKKERASLKALKEVGVFSSRLSKSESNYYDPDSLESEVKQTEEIENEHIQKPVQGNINSEPVKNKRTVDMENGYSVTELRSSIKDRDLPPIPNKTRSPRRRQHSDKESVYEELPLAPRTPIIADNDIHSRHELSNDVDTPDDVDDGYMTPAKFRQLNDDNLQGEFDVVIKRKPPAAPRDSLRYTRARKVKSDYGSIAPTYEHDDEEDIERMFDFTYAEGVNSGPEHPYERRRQPSNGQVQANKSQFPAQIQKQKQFYGDNNRRFIDDSAIESRSLSGVSKLKSRSHKNLNIECNATVRSHNVRKMRTAMDVFNFSDSLRELRQPMQNGGETNLEPTYGRVVDNERIKSYVYGEQSGYGRVGGPHYVESEPGYRKYHRSSSIAALSDSFPKHGDDSAISCGEYGFHGESDYSYSEYSEWHDDGWLPPDDISSLSVLEVSKSLRYIGMKDRVVIRLAREQIDGDMLCSLDKKLLQEGFPELNALDIKKVMDFISGWRPKK